jgi:pyruvate formate lyase activating enzyme
MEEALWVGGWKDISLVDVLESISFTLWTSFCNLKCPWCANSRLARGQERRLVRVSEVVSEVERAAPFVEYFHVTGGEPTLQYKPLTALYKAVRERTGLMLSLDTNATVPRALEHILGEVRVEHVAVDLKAPLSDPEKYAAASGLSAAVGERVVKMVARGLEVLSGRVEFLELRTTLVPGLLSVEDILRVAEDVARFARGSGRLVYVVQQFIPYEGVPPEYRSVKATPESLVAEAARRAAEVLGGAAEVWYRTLESGSRRVA